MVNMYFLGYQALASPYDLVSTYDGKYVRFTSSTGNHGVEGGESQHRHIVQDGTSGNSSTGHNSSNDAPEGMPLHNHPVVGGYTSYSDNDPLYYTLYLYRIDLTIWSSQHRNVPTGAVVLSRAVLSCSGLSRFSDMDGRLVKLGEPNSTGGRSAHTDHTASLSLTSKSPGTAILCFSSYTGYSDNNTHGHSASLSSVASDSIIPSNLAIRFYKATLPTPLAPENMVVFFDGVPDSNWTLLSYDGRFPLAGDVDPTEQGSDTNDHTGTSSIASSAFNAGDCGLGSGGYGSNVTVDLHTHSVPIVLDSVNHVPEYVSLCPYYLNKTLLPMSGAPLMW